MNDDPPRCTYCAEPILDDERLDDFMPDRHRECSVRSVMGGLPHLVPSE